MTLFDDKGNEICAVCLVPRYMHAWVTQPNRVWHRYTETITEEENPA